METFTRASMNHSWCSLVAVLQPAQGGEDEALHPLIGKNTIGNRDAFLLNLPIRVTLVPTNKGISIITSKERLTDINAKVRN